ncbi:unnamed protein product [Ambrosiozyma monospora]|uniref:Unnamed protein product n=1 Tax=Ambrosiozyma monospora TaxID=43982 RepID=A0A9W6YUV1_AMBMO|nr:unnamed protein product [Ambrosiozyma monospora]
MLAIHPNKLQKVVSTIQKLYPIAYADSKWDNTGLLVDSSSSSSSSSSSTSKINVLLTIDLTSSVLEEAISKKANVILAYHPFIFRGLKSITTADPQQRSLIKLIQHGISVYSPHTAIDASPKGMNEWLVNGLVDDAKLQFKSKLFIEPNGKFDDEVGMGRIVELNQKVGLSSIIKNLKTHLGLKYVQLGLRSDVDSVDDVEVGKIAVCVGSGGSLFRGLKDVDLFVTGELSHHEALFFKESGSSVLVCNHSNTERGFLKVLKKQLESAWEEEQGKDGEQLELFVSEKDQDPLQVV